MVAAAQRVSIVFLLGLFVCCLAFAEILEVWNLTVKTSSDFTVARCSGKIAGLVDNVKKSEAQRGTNRTKNRRETAILVAENPRLWLAI